MKGFLERIVVLVAAFLLLPASSWGQVPTISDDGVRNGASYIVAGLPGSSIAQGSIFVVFGDNLGPPQIVQVSSFPLPTAGGLAGTSISISVGGTTANAIMLYTLKTQVAAVLPSNIPVGTGTMTVTYNGVASNPAPITVVPSSMGIFTRNQAGSGPGIIQNYISAGSEPFNTLTESANPGQVVTLWGTGLGAVLPGQLALEASQALPGNRSDIDARIFVGGREAAITYRGRSGCCVGIDQIQFVVPSGVTGCYVPVGIKVGNAVSNFASMSISDSGKVCSDPGGFSPAELAIAQANGGIRLGSISMSKSVSKSQSGALTSAIDSGNASFVRVTLNELLNETGSFAVNPPGACQVTFNNADGGNAAPLQALNAGASIALSGPNGARSMTPTPGAAGTYSSTFSQTSTFPPIAQPQYIVPGTYTFSNGAGGADVGAFSATLVIPPSVTWSNEASVTAVNRLAGQLITWTGGDPSGFTVISGLSATANFSTFAQFVCIERTSTGSFTVPDYVLLALPPGVFGVLAVGTTTATSTFSAPGLDFGYVDYGNSVSKSVTYQ